MNKPTEKTTIYIDPKVKKSVRYYALRDSRSLSDIVNEKLFEYLEDQADIAALEERKNDMEFVPFGQVLKELGLSEKDLQSPYRKAR